MNTIEPINFTKTALVALPIPSTGRTTYRDTKVSGLQIRVSSTGIKTFSLYHRIKNGQPQRLTLGQFPAMSVEYARTTAQRHKADLISGVNLAQRQREQRRMMTFSELFSEYMKRHSKLSKRTWAEDEAKYKQYLQALGRKRLCEITRKDIADIHSDITRSGHPTTANRVLALISSVFGWALSHDIFEGNPARGVRKNREQSRDRFLTPTELPMFINALDAESNVSMRDFFWLALLTGARRSNLLEMAWPDIDLPEAVWHIPRTKNGDPQAVTLSDEALDILQTRKANSQSNYVFPGIGKQGHMAEPKKGWQRIKDRMAGQIVLRMIAEQLHWNEETLASHVREFFAAPNSQNALAGLEGQAESLKVSLPTPILPDLRPHDLRRTFASWQVRTGASLAIIGKSLNHRSTATTAIYARLDQDPVRSSVQRATTAMLNTAERQPSLDSQPIAKRRRKHKKAKKAPKTTGQWPISGRTIGSARTRSRAPARLRTGP